MASQCPLADVSGKSECNRSQEKMLSPASQISPRIFSICVFKRVFKGSPHSWLNGFLLFPEGHADSGVVNGGFPAIRFGKSPDEFLASLAHGFPGPDAFELLLKRDTEFPQLEPIPNVIGEGVQNTMSFIPR
jgi:hypothetical protein